MHKIINASFPRSGHHVMRDVLQMYFGDEMKYCKWSDDFEKRPTVCGETNFTMIHDLHLTFPISDEWKYLVLVRHPIYSLASWRIHHKRDKGDICEDQEISKQKLEFWAKWVNKWVLSPVPNRLIVQYETLCREPLFVLYHVAMFICGRAVNQDRLSACIEHFNIRPNIPNTTASWIGWI